MVRKSENLRLATYEHLNYLVKHNYISHEGIGSSQVTKRALKQGASALSYGEVIGFSPLESELLNNWILSPKHKSVILDDDWRWIGVSVVKKDGLYISVVNFSSGNLGSTSTIQSGERLILHGEYIDDPKFEGSFEIEDLILDRGFFTLIIKPYRKSFFIYGYSGNRVLGDRVDIFFK